MNGLLAFAHHVNLRDELPKQQSQERRINSYLVKDYMTKKVLTISENATAEEAAKIIVEDKLDQGYIIVLGKGKPIGIVTPKDLITKILATGATRKTKVYKIMTSPLITVDPYEDLLSACKIMRENRLRKLPVIKDDIIYGIITTKDVVYKIKMYIDKSSRDIIRFMPLQFF